ncbi:MAG: hypothetical protein ACH350_00235 [Parachlamydiaceae bacterium]
MHTDFLLTKNFTEYQIHENPDWTVPAMSNDAANCETKGSELSVGEKLIQLILEKSQRIAETTHEFSIHNFDCSGIAVRQLGPVAAWGGKLIVHGGTIELLKNLIKAVSAEMRVKISGFIWELDDGGWVFHMSRWPRRVDVLVPPISESKQILERLVATAERFFFEAVSKEEAWGAPHARALLGLEEGYFDGRRKNIIIKWDAAQDKSLESLICTLSTEIGDLEQFGIDIHSFQEAGELVECLRNTILTTRHRVEEVIQGIESSAVTFTPAYIYSIDQPKDCCYEEPAVIVEGPNSECFFADVVKVGHAMHQARFSYEDFSCGAAWNVEILDYCENAAARLR